FEERVDHERKSKKEGAGKGLWIIARHVVESRNNDRTAGKKVEEDHQCLPGDAPCDEDGKRNDERQEQDRKQEQSPDLPFREETGINRGEEQDRSDESHIDKAGESEGASPGKDSGIPRNVCDATEGKCPGCIEQAGPAPVPEPEIEEYSGSGKGCTNFESRSKRKVVGRGENKKREGEGCCHAKNSLKKPGKKGEYGVPRGRKGV